VFGATRVLTIGTRDLDDFRRSLLRTSLSEDLSEYH
jgi:hypothetical protein